MAPLGFAALWLPFRGRIGFTFLLARLRTGRIFRSAGWRGVRRLPLLDARSFFRLAGWRRVLGLRVGSLRRYIRYLPLRSFRIPVRGRRRRPERMRGPATGARVFNARVVGRHVSRAVLRYILVAGRSWRATGMELGGPRGRQYRRLTVVHGSILRPVLAGNVLVLLLRGDGGDVPFVLGGHLSGSGPRIQTAGAAIVAYSRNAYVIHDWTVIYIGDVCHIDVVDRPVIKEILALPVSSLVTDSGVAEAVVDSAIEPDMRAPISRMPGKESVAPAPIAGCP